LPVKIFRSYLVILSSDKPDTSIFTHDPIWSYDKAVQPINQIFNTYHRTRLYGSIGLSLFAHTVIFASLGFALTLSHQQLIGNQNLTEIIAILDFQDLPSNKNRSPINATVISPVEPLNTTIAKSRPQKNNSSHQPKTNEASVKKSPLIPAIPVKINPPAPTITKNVSSVSENLSAKNPPDKSQPDVSQDQVSTQEESTDYIAAKSMSPSQHQGNDSVMLAPRYNGPGLTNPRPKYPRLARKKGYAGDVLLKVNVSKIGIVAAVSIAQSSGFSLLDQSALRTITTWRFLPAESGGDAVDAEILVPVSFRLVN